MDLSLEWTDKINHLGHIINHGDDDCLSKKYIFVHPFPLTYKHHCIYTLFFIVPIEK